MNVLIVIPCYNHNKSSSRLVSLINKKYNILLIDDGSSHEYQYENQSNLNVYRNKINKGKGYCIKFAANYAKRNQFTHILVIDADLQHNPKFIDQFIDKSNKRKIIYGRRKFDNKMPFLRILSNTISSYIISLLCNVKIYDTQCGYRLYDVNIFEKINSKQNGYIFESEIFLKCISKNHHIDYVNIDTIYNNSVSSINKIKDSIIFIKLILKNLRLYAANR